MKNLKIKMCLFSIIFIVLLNSFSNVSALYLNADGETLPTPFSPQDYVVSTSGNYTTITWNILQYPFYDALQLAKYFMLNVSYDDLPEEIHFDLIPLSLSIHELSHAGRVTLGLYQSYVNIDLYDIVLEDYTTLGTIYQSGSLFEDQFSFPDIYLMLQSTNYNFTKSGNNLYSSMFRFILTDYTNLIISGQPGCRYFITLQLFHDYEDLYDPIDVVSSLPIYDSGGGIIREEAEGAVFDRFIENASFIFIMFIIPVFMTLKINQKMLGLMIIMSSLIGYFMSIVTITQIIISVICAILIIMNNAKSEDI